MFLALAIWLPGFIFMVAGLYKGIIEHIGIQGILFILGLHINTVGLVFFIYYKSKITMKVNQIHLCQQ